MSRSIKKKKFVPSIEVRQSPIHGSGVFALEAIPKGTQIIEYTGQRIPWESVADQAESEITYFFGIEDGNVVIDPDVGGNDARYINHACDPNCEAIEEEDGRVFIHATREIAPGEELFYDYQLSVDDRTEEAEQESVCYCGAETCRGTMLEPVQPN
jgi:SET domain-containing protein